MGQKSIITETYRDIYYRWAKHHYYGHTYKRQISAMWNHFFKQRLNIEKGLIRIGNSEFYISPDINSIFRVLD